VSRDLRLYSLRGLAFAFVVLCDAQIIAHKTIIVISKRRRKSDAIAGLVFGPSQLAIWSPVSPFCQLCGLSHRKAEKLRKTEKLTTQRARGIDELDTECWTLFMASQCHKLQAQAVIPTKRNQSKHFHFSNYAEIKAKNVLIFCEATSPPDANLFARARKRFKFVLGFSFFEFRFSVFGFRLSVFGFRCKLNTLRLETRDGSDFIRSREPWNAAILAII